MLLSAPSLYRLVLLLDPLRADSSYPSLPLSAVCCIEWVTLVFFSVVLFSSREVWDMGLDSFVGGSHACMPDSPSGVLGGAMQSHAQLGAVTLLHSQVAAPLPGETTQRFTTMWDLRTCHSRFTPSNWAENNFHWSTGELPTSMSYTTPTLHWLSKKLRPILLQCGFCMGLFPPFPLPLTRPPLKPQGFLIPFVLLLSFCCLFPF